MPPGAGARRCSHCCERQPPDVRPQGQQPGAGCGLAWDEPDLGVKVEIVRMNVRPLLSGSSTGLSASAMGRRSWITVPSDSERYS